MTVVSVSSNDRSSDDDLVAAIQELQRIKFSVVAGAGSASNIAVTGIATEDTLVGVVQFNVVADTGTSATGNKVDDVADLLAEASITSAGNIQLSTTVTTGDKLLVIWLNKN